MEDMEKVLVINRAVRTVPVIPKIAKAKGNVPTSEEYNSLVAVVNMLTTQLKDSGTLK